MKGIILAGGTGSRLYPTTVAVSKQLLPVYDKPLVYYPLSTLMLAGIRDILIVCNPSHAAQFHDLLGDGSAFGLSINYAIQSEPKGIPDAFVVGKHFIGHEDVFLVLGDNILYGSGLTEMLSETVRANRGCTVFPHRVRDPSRFGVLTLDEHGQAVGVEEKPTKPTSNLALTGHYVFDNDIVEISKSLKPSPRGETEITEAIQLYMEKQKLDFCTLGRGFAWFDTGTHNSLLEASQFVETIEARQGTKIACIEEIAFNNGWMTIDEVLEKVKAAPKNCYSEYLRSVALVGASHGVEDIAETYFLERMRG